MIIPRCLEDTIIEDVLKKVESLHNRKEYAEAIRILETHKTAMSPGLWHYNLGVLYGKLNQLPLARYHLMMADKVGYSTKELFSNKLLVQEKLESSKFEMPLNFRDFIISGSLSASQGMFTLLSLLIIIFSIICMMKKTALKLSLFFAMMACFLMGYNFWVMQWPQSIVLEKVDIHEGPSSIFGLIGEIPPGVRLIVTTEGEWQKIIYPSRFSGWIKKGKALKELK